MRALGRDFHLLWEPDGDRLREMVRGGRVDVMLLDLDSEAGNVEQQVGFFDEIRGEGMPAIVLADDGARATAVELVERGAHSHCRKPPALRELKAILLRACEYVVLKQAVEGKQTAEGAQAAPGRQAADSAGRNQCSRFRVTESSDPASKCWGCMSESVVSLV